MYPLPWRFAYSSIQLQRSARLELEITDQLPITGPTLVLVEQDDEQRRGVGAAVVRGVRTLLERGELAVTHLVEDPARVLVAEVVGPRALPHPEFRERRRGKFGRERQGLQAGEDAVASEHGHEPGQAGGRQASPSCSQR